MYYLVQIDLSLVRYRNTTQGNQPDRSVVIGILSSKVETLLYELSHYDLYNTYMN